MSCVESHMRWSGEHPHFTRIAPSSFYSKHVVKTADDITRPFRRLPSRGAKQRLFTV